MFVVLTLALTCQAPATQPPHWFVFDPSTAKSKLYLWGEKDARGYIRGTIPPAGAAELAWVRPGPRAINFGLDLARMPTTSSIRGTDKDLGRELAGALIEQRPCPGPGPCPAPPRPPGPPKLPDPVAPEPPPLNLPVLAIAGVFALLSFFVVGLFLVVLVIRSRRP